MALKNPLLSLIIMYKWLVPCGRAVTLGPQFLTTSLKLQACVCVK